MKTLLPIAIRDMNDSDQALIHSSWCTECHRVLPNSLTLWNNFCLNQNQLIDNIQTISKTLIACLSEEPDVIIGYLCYSHIDDNLIIHYAYTKKNFRHQHVMTDLLSFADPDYRTKLIAVTNYTERYRSLANYFKMVYDPFIINTLLQFKEIHE